MGLGIKAGTLADLAEYQRHYAEAQGLYAQVRGVVTLFTLRHTFSTGNPTDWETEVVRLIVKGGPLGIMEQQGRQWLRVMQQFGPRIEAGVPVVTKERQLR